MCWVGAFDIAAVARMPSRLHMYNIVIEDRCDLKKWLGGGGGSLIGRDS